MSEEDLFSRLIKHRTTRQRHVENFLTEILAEFLNRLGAKHRDLHREFILKLLLANCERPTQILRFKAQIATHIVWKSQHPVDWGGQVKWADLVLLVGRRPLMVVESKVNAPIGVLPSDQDEGEEEDREKVNQLHVYGKWLCRKNPQGALVFLTYAAEDPPNFRDGDYGVKTRSICRWVRVTEWLSRKSARINDPVVKYLSEQIGAFLKRESISQMEKKDVELLGKFFNQRIKLDDLDEQNNSRLDNGEKALFEVAGATKKKLAGEKPTYEYGALLCSRSVSGAEGFRLKWGFTSGNNENWFAADEKPGLVACAIIVFDVGEGTGLSSKLGKKLSQWGTKTVHDDNYPCWYKIVSASTLLNDQKGFSRAFEEWTFREIMKAEKLLLAAAKQSPKRKSA